MIPKSAGFCRGCNGYSEHLAFLPVKNNNTGKIEVSLFCPECRHRFGLWPYDRGSKE